MWRTTVQTCRMVWIANHLTVDGGAMLYKEINVMDIPDGMQSEYEWNN